MTEQKEQQNLPVEDPPEQEIQKPRKPGKRVIFRMPDGSLLPASDFKGISKFDKDVITYYHGEEKVVTPATEKRKEKTEWVVDYDPDAPLLGQPIKPSENSPICKQCGLYEHGCQSPFIPYAGAEQPVVTIIFDSVTRPEDINGELGTDGSSLRISQIITNAVRETGVRVEDVRWVPMTRCANRSNKTLDMKSRGNWCRYHVVDDLMRHPPALIIPVGTAALGLLSHKSNAGEWGGRVLTYRGWPDDWLTSAKYALPRPDPRTEGKTITGHPVFGQVPDWRIPMVPIQAPRLIDKERSETVSNRWRNDIIRALKLAKAGVKAMNYMRVWYKFTDDVEVIEAGLNELLQHPGILLCYDTETTGLRPWSENAAIVAMMFRWVDPDTKLPRSLGFPWNYPTKQQLDRKRKAEQLLSSEQVEVSLIPPTKQEIKERQKRLKELLRITSEPLEASKIQEHIPRLKKLVWKVLTQSKLVGHHLSFDMLYTYATFWRSHLVGWADPGHNRKLDRCMSSLANACQYDTWHMAFAFMQKRGSLGLEVIAYDWVPDLAGYEEDMTLLIDLHTEAMHPKSNKGGHYLNCSKSWWPTHVVPYCMGDVEVCHRAHDRILDKLETCKQYKFPLAHPEMEGCFRSFTPPDRNWMYHQIMAPAASVLMKLMARGLFIDEDELTRMETCLPNTVMKLRESLKTVDPLITAWVEKMERTQLVKQEKGKPEAKWELDLENKSQMKDLLFNVLKIPVLRLTKGGRKLLGDNIEDVKLRMAQAIAQDKPDLSKEALAEAVEVELRKVAAVDKFTINKICAEYEKYRPLQDYRKAYKLYTTYVRPLKNLFTEKLDKKAREADQHLCFDNCIHASFMLTGTRGGRLSCRDPNLQQLPRDGEVKSMFVSRFGKRGCVYQGDLSQVELRLLAAACGDPTMIQAYFDEADLHSLTASRIFGIPYEHFLKGHMQDLQTRGKSEEAKKLDLNRTLAKTVNFLTGYGGGAFGLQNVLAMRSIYKKIEECQAIIDAFFDAYPAMRTWLQKYKRFILDNHVAVSIFGRVRIFEEVLSRDEEAIAKALRAGCNHLIQSTASDMMLIALFVIEAKMREANLESILVSTVHDSLVIDCVRSELSVIHEIVMETLDNFPDVFKALFGADYDTSWMIVPFTGDYEVGLNYLSTRKIPKKDVDWDKLLA